MLLLPVALSLLSSLTMLLFIKSCQQWTVPEDGAGVAYLAEDVLHSALTDLHTAHESKASQVQVRIAPGMCVCVWINFTPSKNKIK